MGLFNFGKRNKYSTIEFFSLNKLCCKYVKMHMVHDPPAKGDGWKRGMKSYREVVPKFAKDVGVYRLQRITQQEWDDFVEREIIHPWKKYYRRGIANFGGYEVPDYAEYKDREEADKWVPPVIEDIDFYGIDIGKPFREHPIEIIPASRYLGEEGYKDSYVLTSLNGKTSLPDFDTILRRKTKFSEYAYRTGAYGQKMPFEHVSLPLTFRHCSFYGAKMSDLATWSVIFEDDLFYNTDFKGSYLVQYTVRGNTPYANKFEYCDFRRAFIEPPIRDNFPSPYFTAPHPYRGSFNGMQLEHCDFRGSTFQYIFDYGLVGTTSFRYSWFDKETRFVMTAIERADFEGAKGIEEAKTFFGYINIPIREAEYKAKKSFWYVFARGDFPIRHLARELFYQQTDLIKDIELFKKGDMDMKVPVYDEKGVNGFSHYRITANSKPEERLAIHYIYDKYINDVDDTVSRHNKVLLAEAKLYGIGKEYFEPDKDYKNLLYLTEEGKKIAYERVKNDLGVIRKEMPDMKELKDEWFHTLRHYGLLVPLYSWRNKAYKLAVDRKDNTLTSKIILRLPLYVPTKDELAKDRELLISFYFYLPGFSKVVWNKGNFIVPDYMLKNPEKYGIHEYKEIFGTDSLLDYALKLYPKRTIPYKEGKKLVATYSPIVDIEKELKEAGEEEAVEIVESRESPYILSLAQNISYIPFRDVATVWDGLTYDMIEYVDVPYGDELSRVLGMGTIHTHKKLSAGLMEMVPIRDNIEILDKIKAANLYLAMLEKAREDIKNDKHLIKEVEVMPDSIKNTIM